LTVLVMVGLALVIGEILRLGATQDRGRWQALILAAAIGAVGLIPTIQNLGAYGSPLFIYVAADHNFIPMEARPSLNLVSHGVVFLVHMARKWAALEPAQALQLAGFILVACVVVATMVVWAGDRWRSGARLPGPAPISAARLIATAYAWSAAVTVSVHSAFGWRMFVRMGDLTAAQPRYYYAVWPGVALAGALLLRALPPGRWQFYGTVVFLLLMALSTIQIAALSAALSGTALHPS